MLRQNVESMGHDAPAPVAGVERVILLQLSLGRGRPQPGQLLGVRRRKAAPHRTDDHHRGAQDDSSSVSRTRVRIPPVPGRGRSAVRSRRRGPRHGREGHFSKLDEYGAGEFSDRQLVGAGKGLGRSECLLRRLGRGEGAAPRSSGSGAAWPPARSTTRWFPAMTWPIRAFTSHSGQGVGEDS